MRRSMLLGAVVFGAVMIAEPLSSQAAPRFDAGVSVMLSPAKDSHIPEIMVGPVVNLSVAQVAGGNLGVEGAFRFRADGNQMHVCPQPPGVVCDIRNVKTLITAGLAWRKGFGVQPLVQGPIMRLGLGGAFTALKGSATIYPYPDGTHPDLLDLKKQSAVADIGLGWIQRLGAVPVRIEGRVSGFAPELAKTRYVYGLQLGIGY